MLVLVIIRRISVYRNRKLKIVNAEEYSKLKDGEFLDVKDMENHSDFGTSLMFRIQVYEHK